MESSDSAQRVDQLLKLEELRHRFEIAWRAGERPEIGDCLEEVLPALRGELFADLLGVELELRQEAGEQPTAIEYHERYPAFQPLVERVYHECVNEVPAPPTELRPGSVVGDYRIEREIGRGGMGVVYQAVQVSLGRQVALKVLIPNGRADSASRSRFLREARAAARLHHTNIVPILDLGEHDGNHYYAMQLIRGRPLDQVLTEQRAERDANPASDAANKSGRTGFWRQISRLGWHLADAVQYAHEQGVLHRDIKPANLLVDDQDHVWLTDFGLAKTEDSDLTLRDEVVGTLRYLAPEAFAGETDARTDVYSLGLTLYELLSLRPPFPVRDRGTLIQQIQCGEIVPLSQLAPDVPRDLATVVSKAIQRDPQDRYQTARQLADDLDRFWHEQPILARRHSAFGLLTRWIRRNPTVAALTGSLALLLLIISVGSTLVAVYFRRQQELHRELAEQRNTQRLAAERLATTAELAQRQVVRSLASLHSDEGVRALARGDHIQASLSTALALDQLTDQRPMTTAIDEESTMEQSLRSRLAALLEYAPHIRARQTFDVHDWRLTGLNGFVRARTSNPPQLEFADNGELCIVSLLGDVAFRWNLDDDTYRRITLGSSSDPAPESSLVAEVRYTRDAEYAMRFAPPGNLELWSCSPETRVCQLEPVPDGAANLLGGWISPNKQRMVACFANREPSLALLICDMVKGTILSTHTLPLVSPRKNMYLGTQFSSDSRRAIFWGDYATVLNLETGTLIRPTMQNASSDIVLDPGGQFLVASRAARLVLQDLEAPDDSLAETELPMPLNASAICLAIDRAGRWLTAGTLEGAVYVMDVAKKKLTGAPIRHQDGAIECLQVNPQGNAVAAADSHGFVRAWSLPAGLPLTPPLRLDEPIASLAWDNGGQRLAAATISGDITLWDLERRPAVRMLDASNTHVSPAPDGNQMFCWGVSEGASVWDLTTDPPHQTANLPQISVVAADWNAAGTKLAIASNVKVDGNKSIEFRLWDPKQPRADLITTQQSYHLHAGDMFTRFIDEDNRLIVRAPTGPAVVDLEDGEETFRFELTPHVSFVQYCFAVSNRIVAVCERMTSPSNENRLRVWDSTGRLEFETRLPSARRVFSLRLSPDSRLLAAEGEFGVRLWRCRESNWEPVDMPKADQSVAFIDFDRRSTLLAYVDDSSMCHVVRLADSSLPTTSFYVPGVPIHANFSPDGRRLALVTNQHGVSIWDWSRGEPLTPNYRQDGTVRQVLFAPDGNHLVLVGRNSGLEWLSIPAAQTTPWKELKRQVQQVTGLTWSADRSVRRLTATEWKQLAESPASHGSTER